MISAYIDYYQWQPQMIDPHLGMLAIKDLNIIKYSDYQWQPQMIDPHLGMLAIKDLNIIKYSRGKKH
jgi:hypothetical protein